MNLSPALLDKLVCPVCHGKLDNQKKEAKLICNACRLAYPVKNNIPVMLPDEADKLEAK